MAYKFSVNIIVSPQKLFRRDEKFKKKASKLMKEALTESIDKFRKIYVRNTTGGIINSAVLSQSLVVRRAKIPSTFFKVKTERFGFEPRIEPIKQPKLYMSIAHQWEFGTTEKGASFIRAKNKRFMTVPNIGAPGVRRTSVRPAGSKGRWSPRLRFATIKGKPVLIQNKTGNAQGLSTGQRIKFWLRSSVRVREATSFWQKTLEQTIGSGMIERALEAKLNKSFKISRRN